MLKGFRDFISQGNVVDLAVAVIIGNAFKPIVDKVTAFIMGILAQLIGSPNFDSVLQFKIDPSSKEYIQPGAILTQGINFLLVAAAVYFCIVLPMNKMRERKAAKEAAAPSCSARSATCWPSRTDLLFAYIQVHTGTYRYIQNRPSPIKNSWGFIGKGRFVSICNHLTLQPSNLYLSIHSPSSPAAQCQPSRH